MSTPKRPGRRPDPRSKRSQGIDRHTMPRKVFHGPAELIDRLERYAREKHGANDSEAIRALLGSALSRAGF